MEPERLDFQGEGVRLAAERWSAGVERGVVVLLHGGGQTRHSWIATARRVAERGWSAIALDLRGHGESEWAANGDYTIERFVDDLLALVRTLDAPPVLIGASLGGMVALVAAGEHPGLARALVLVDVVVEVEPEGAARIVGFLAGHLDGFASLDEVADAIAAYNPVRRRTRNLDGLRKVVRQRGDGRWYWHWDPAFARIGDEAQRRASPARLSAAAAAIDVPTLLVRGGKSDLVSEAGLAAMRELIPHAQTVEIGGAGHMVAGDDNDVFATRLEGFLERLD